MRVIETDGARISYERVGEGPAVLLVQGVGVVGEGWRPQVEALRRSFTVVTLDNRGIGGARSRAARRCRSRRWPRTRSR